MSATPDNGPHYTLIQQHIPTWLSHTSWPRAQALSKTSLAALPDFAPIAAHEHAKLKALNAHAWTTQNAVDERLKALQDLYAFAQPLLLQALKNQYALDLDVKATYLFLHSATGTLIKGTTSRTVSLLDAALHNFAGNERFTESSSYINQPDARGHFTIVPLKHRMSIEQFIALCRELDVGQRYQRHLQQHLLPTLEADKNALQRQVIASQKAALNGAAHLALFQKAIDPATFHVVQRALDGQRGVMQFYRLRMQDTLLTGILLIAADLDNARDVAPVLAYIPHDPHGPIKAYPSAQALMSELTQRLQDSNYRRFFSQFVDQQQRGHFFSTLTARQSFGAHPIDGDLWPYLFQQSLNKILNDARELAISTADSDSRARQAWWDNFSKVLEDIFNAALLVVTPLVPFLGELMLAYTAYQLLDEVVEGVVDLAEGQTLEAATHLVGVVSDVVQLATFGAAAEFAQSSFVNQLKAVQVNGKARLWNPDLRPYEYKDLILPQDSTPDALGLHPHQGQNFLPLDGKHYAVALDGASGAQRIQHPTRPDAYAPHLHHNGQGAWRHEAENPRTWDEPQLLRRLGHSVADLNDRQLAQVRAISGTEPGALRAAHVDSGAPPPLLLDSLKRFRLNQEAQQLPQRIRAGQAVDEDTYWSPHMARELPGWPADRAIEVFESPDLTGESIHYGAAEAEHTLAISRQDLNHGKLPERLVDFLGDEQLSNLLDPLPESRALRIDALRERLADNLAQRHPAVFEYLYRHSEDVTSEHASLIRQAFPDLPNNVVQALLEQARPAERAIMSEAKRLPLRLKNLAREWALDSRASHAVEGFYQPRLLNADTERLALNTLKLHSDAFANLRLQVRQHSPSGELRCEVGPEDARQIRLLVRDEQGQYAVYDNQHLRLQPPRDFYSALLATLPTDTSQALGDGAHLQDWLMARLASLGQRRSVLATDTPPSLPQQEDLLLVQAPRFKWVSRLLGISPPSLEERVKALYPRLRPQYVAEQVEAFGSAEGRQTLRQLEAEKKALVRDLEEWVKSPTYYHQGDTEQQNWERALRSNLSKALRQSWENAVSGYVDDFGERQLGSHLDLVGWPLGRYLKAMPQMRTPFERVTSLNLTDTDLIDRHDAFLQLFPNLIYLDLGQNKLTRLPDAVGAMPRLTWLNLRANPLQWQANSLARLKGLRQLRHLSLSDNRALSTPPDISRMPHLRSLSLHNTAVSDWPTGLFDRPRPASFFLDLQNTQINNVPQFLPWQAEAELVARTRLDRNQLSSDAQQRLVSYRLGAGLDPYRSYPARGDVDFWLESMPEADHAQLTRRWQELEQEHGSQGFFEVLKSLEQPDYFEVEEDQQRYLDSRRELTRNLWRMLTAMHADPELRNRLFVMASNPVTCADAGAHVFNAMGFEVLLNEINRTGGALRERRLAELAKGKTRLARVNQVAQDDIRHRVTPQEHGGLGLRFSTQMLDGLPGSVDEVEVYLAYQSALKQRLDLPWVSEHMTYRTTAAVDDSQLNDAFARVTAQEADDGLVDGMLEQPFWDDYLHQAYPEQFQASRARSDLLSDPLDDLMFAQKDWARAKASADEQQATLKQRLLALADALNVPHAQVLTGEAMTPQVYAQILAGGFTGDVPSEQQLARRLSREALQRPQQEPGAA